MCTAKLSQRVSCNETELDMKVLEEVGQGLDPAIRPSRG